MIDKLLSVAAGEIGVTEKPANSNNVKYNTFFYGKAVVGTAYPWCCTFVAWCFEQAGLASVWIDSNTRKTALCQWVYNTARAKGRLVTEAYRRGDVLLFDFDGNRKTEHIGLCESVSDDGKTLTTIEGNTGASSDANGGAVMRRTRASSVVLGAFRPLYTKEDDEMKRYKTIAEIRSDPDLKASVRTAYADALDDFKRRGIAIGRSDSDLDLTEDMLRGLIYCDRITKAAK